MSRTVRIVAGASALVLIGILAFAIGRVNATDFPGNNSVEAGFARDMSVHHGQAVTMTGFLRQNQLTDDIEQLAIDIETTQQAQIGQMQGWLDVWGLPIAGNRAPMEWAGDEHATHGDGSMQGMATQAQLDQLDDATGSEAETIFLQLMITHHVGGVEMAEVALERTDNTQVTRLARSMVAAQKSEITVMNSMLQARGAAPVAVFFSSNSGSHDDGHGHGASADPSTTTPPPEEGSSADLQVDVAYRGGEVITNEPRVTVQRGQTVRIQTTSDVPDEMHVHGYDRTVTLPAGQPASATFTADIGGVFEVELHEADELLLTLLVQG